MKESIFNIHAETKRHKLLFNSLSCALCEIDDRYFNVLNKKNNGENLLENELELLNGALVAGFFVEDDVDEIDCLRINKYRAKFSEECLTITIAPTLACNFQCIYCYESNKSGFMQEKTENRILEYIEGKANRIKQIKLTWYGGEPLLARKTIFRMSEKICDICNRFNINYRAAIITNGSLIRDKDANLFKKYHIDTVQITLDGPAQIHNSRRRCNGIENNFEVIINNINLLIKNKISINLRVNVDKENIDKMDTLLENLSDKLISKKIHIGFAPVQACTDACAGVSNTCFNTEEFSEQYFELYDLIERYGFDIGTKLRYFYPRVNYCGADIYSSFVVDPEGYMYKCWHDVGCVEKSIGSVKNIDKALQSSKTAKWLFSDVTLNNECKNCMVLPLCMGGCPSMNFYKSCEHTCQECKYNISEILIRNYYKHITL